MFKLVPKNGKGCAWYTDRKNIFKTGLIEAVDKEGFKTLVNIDNYNIIKYGGI